MSDYFMSFIDPDDLTLERVHRIDYNQWHEDEPIMKWDYFCKSVQYVGKYKTFQISHQGLIECYEDVDFCRLKDSNDTLSVSALTIHNTQEKYEELFQKSTAHEKLRDFGGVLRYDYKVYWNKTYTTKNIIDLDDHEEEPEGYLHPLNTRIWRAEGIWQT